MGLQSREKRTGKARRLDDQRQRDLFARLQAALAKAGLFVESGAARDAVLVELAIGFIDPPEPQADGNGS